MYLAADLVIISALEGERVKTVLLSRRQRDAFSYIQLANDHDAWVFSSSLTPVRETSSPG